MRRPAVILTFLLLLASSCTELDSLRRGEIPAYDGPWRRTFLLYSAGYHNLSGALEDDVEELCTGYVPDPMSEDVLLVFSHRTASYGDYTTPHAPVLMRITKYDGTVYRDTISVYPSSSIACDPTFFSKVLGQAYEEYPSESRGLLISSHGSGWIPSGYTDDETSFWMFRPRIRRPYFADGLTKAVIAHYYYNNRRTLCEQTMDIDELAAAIPAHLDFLIFDCCLMGGVECMYALRNSASYIVATPTETMSEGFNYKRMGKSVYGPDDARSVAENVAADLAAKFDSQDGTVAAVDCSAVDSLASACAALAESYADSVLEVKQSKVQHYNHDSNLWFFYDLRDIFASSGATEEELRPLDRALEKAVIYKGSSYSFFGNRIDTARFSGLSMYLPRADHPKLNAHYRKTEWNAAVGLVKDN